MYTNRDQDVCALYSQKLSNYTPHELVWLLLFQPKEDNDDLKMMHLKYYCNAFPVNAADAREDLLLLLLLLLLQTRPERRKKIKLPKPIIILKK